MNYLQQTIQQNDSVEWLRNQKIGPWDLCWLKQWYIDQVFNQKIPLLQGRQFYQDHCQPIAPSTDNSKSYFT